MSGSIPLLDHHGIHEIMIRNNILPSPTFQIIDIKKFGSAATKYKLTLSDGNYFTVAFLNQRLNHLIENDEIKNLTVIRILDYIVHPTHDRPLIVIQNLECIKHLDVKYGDPKDIDVISSQLSQLSSLPSPKQSPCGSIDTQGNNSANAQGSAQQYTNDRDENSILTPPLDDLSAPPTPPRLNEVKNANRQQQNGIIQQNLNQFFNQTQNTVKRHCYIDICYLNPYINQWMILARVVMKGSVFNFNGRDKKPGKLLNITLKDKSGSEIRGTFFNELVDLYDPIIEQGKVYQITGNIGMIREKNSKFNSTLHDYEISFNSSVKIQPMPDDSSIGNLTYRFVKLASLLNSHPKSSVDILAYVVKVSELTQISTPFKQAEKREVILADDSNVKCNLTLWDNDARNFPNDCGFIVALKDAKLSDYKGRTLSSPSVITAHPNITDFPEVLDIQKWLDINKITPNEVGYFDKIESISDNMGKATNYIFLSQINELGLGSQENKADFGTAYLVLSDIFVNRKLYYPACPNQECNYKGLIFNNDSYYCQKCQRVIEEPAYRYNFAVRMADFSGTATLNVLGDDRIGSLFTGVDAMDWHNQTDGLEESEIRQLVIPRFFTPVKVRCMMKTETYGGNSRIKINISSAKVIDFAEGAKFFANEIKKFL